ncbi:peptidase S14 [Sphingomonas oleivorans]|uniref:Peptidase S14 n=1 Tax=Sphingomonas oleivorans TaxID=1735121 RepID=A0A2T5G1G3_9SPHN|nr:head maturation protease, ClpP-related [Sphingomonas oleivorans]PTQ12951.1 peptidase S14 [Sphingomonas oleivorans]
MINRKLLNLIRDNSGKGAGIRAETADDVATIYVYDTIDPYWGVSAAEFARVLAGIDANQILLRINSPGGDVFEARAMMTALSEHKATVTAKIDGLAASAATALSLAADRVEIADGGFYMIHNAWTFMLGNADELRTTAGLLDKIDATLREGYAGKTGKTDAEIAAWMKAETWFSAQEAVENGFADAVLETAPAAKAQAYNLAVYQNAPQALTDAQPDDAARQRMLSRLRLYERTA